MESDTFQERLARIRTPEGLRAAREETELSQVEFAELVEVKRPNIVAMENGKRPIGKKVGTRILHAIDFYMYVPPPEDQIELHASMEAIVKRVFERAAAREEEE